MMYLVAFVAGLLPSAWLAYRLTREVKLTRALEQKILAREAMAKDLYEENQHMLAILAGNRQTRRAAAAEAKKLLRN